LFLLTECNVGTIKPRTRSEGDKKLGGIGVWTGVDHCKLASSIMFNDEVLICVTISDVQTVITQLTYLQTCFWERSNGPLFRHFA
jgi:hypothetical protein